MPDPAAHIYIPQIFQGYGQPIFQEISMPTVAASPPSPTGTVLPTYAFFVTPFGDGSALVTWPVITAAAPCRFTVAFCR